MQRHTYIYTIMILPVPVETLCNPEELNLLPAKRNLPLHIDRQMHTVSQKFDICLWAYFTPAKVYHVQRREEHAKRVDSLPVAWHYKQYYGIEMKEALILGSFGFQVVQ